MPSTLLVSLSVAFSSGCILLIVAVILCLLWNCMSSLRFTDQDNLYPHRDFEDEDAYYDAYHDPYNYDPPPSRAPSRRNRPPSKRIDLRHAFV